MSDVQVSEIDVKAVVKRHWGDRAPTFDDAVHHAIHSEDQRQAWLKLLKGVTGGRTLDAKVALVEGAWGRRNQVQPDYETIHEALPLYGGRPPEMLTAMLDTCGFGDVVVTPLLDAALWGDTVRDGRYLITAVRG
jgi:hypothetical protein